MTESIDIKKEILDVNKKEKVIFPSEIRTPLLTNQVVVFSFFFRYSGKKNSKSMELLK